MGKPWVRNDFFFFFHFLLLIMCFTSYFVFSIAVLPHSPGVFYQLLRVQHGCSPTQSWGSVLPSIVETRD